MIRRKRDYPRFPLGARVQQNSLPRGEQDATLFMPNFTATGTVMRTKPGFAYVIFDDTDTPGYHGWILNEHLQEIK